MKKPRLSWTTIDGESSASCEGDTLRCRMVTDDDGTMWECGTDAKYLDLERAQLALERTALAHARRVVTALTRRERA